MFLFVSLQSSQVSTMSIVKKNSGNTFEEICSTYFNDLQIWKEEDDAIDILVSLMNAIRPSNIKEFKVISIANVLHYFIQNPTEKARFITYIRQLLRHKNFDRILTDAGIL